MLHLGFLLLSCFLILKRMKNLLDRAGLYTSAACIIHCLVPALLLTTSTTAGFLLFLDPALESAMLALSALFASLSFIPSYLRRHRSCTPLALVITGFAFILLTKAFSLTPEPVWTSVGVAFIGIAHWRNIKLTQLVAK